MENELNVNYNSEASGEAKGEAKNENNIKPTKNKKSKTKETKTKQNGNNTDAKVEALREFAELYNSINTTVVSKEVGDRIWTLWQRYTGRTDRWRGCSGCLVGKVRFLKNRCVENGIEI